MKKFTRFTAEYRPITLSLNDRDNISFDEEKIKEKELLIREIINELYPGLKPDKSMLVNGYMVSGELIYKAQKNISILYEIVSIAISLGLEVNIADDIINFIKGYRKELFYPGGQFFDRIYSKLGGMTSKGNQIEIESDNLFKRFASSKGIQIQIQKPSYLDDIAGIDSYFEIDNRKYTIQTKTLSSIEEDGDFYKIKISGDFTRIKTHYIVLIPETGSILTKKYIFKGKDSIRENYDGVDFYKIPKLDLLYTESKSSAKS